MSVEALEQGRRRAAHGDEVGWLGRAGLAAKGAIYALIGLLALQVALDGRDSAERPDKEGALQLVVEQPFGKVLLGLLAVGFAAYALWRLAQAVVDRESKGDGAKGLARRAGYAAVGIWYAVLTLLAISKLLSGSSSGGSGGSGGRSEESQATAGVFDLPLGRWLVLGVAAGFVAAAGVNIYRAFSGKLEDHLDRHMSEGTRKTVLAVGSVGHIARGVVFGLIGLFLAKAALEFDSQEARGLDATLLELAQQPYGPAMLAAVAVGLGAYAVWCWVEARYRAT